MTEQELNKACEWLEKYMESLGYIDEWCRNGEDTFRKAMAIKDSLTTAENNAESRFIDKACDWLCQHFRDIDNPDFYTKRHHPTEIQSMYHWSVGEMVADFRKAMTKED